MRRSLSLRLAALTLALACAPSTVVALDPQAAITQYAKLSWSERDGLPSGLIWAITQDADGYIWLGTESGLVRFDGVRFVTWTAVAGTALPNGAVRALMTSRSGDLWISFESGTIGRLRLGRITLFTPEDGTPDRVVALVEDSAGSIWAGGIGGLSRFQDGQWQRIARDLPPTDMFRVLHVDQAGSLWVAPQAGGVYKAPASSQNFQRVLPPSTAIRSFFEDNTGTMWTFGPSFLGKYTQGSFHEAPHWLRKVAGPFGGTRAVIHDSSGNLWIGTVGRGLLRVSTQTSNPNGQWLTTQNGLTSNVVRCLYEDREGNIWVGTQSGLNRLSNNSLIAMVPLEASQTASSIAAAPDGSVWVGTNQGIFQVSGERIRRFGLAEGLPGGSIGALHVDREGTVWVAAGGHVASYQDGRFTSLPNVALNTVWGLTADLRGGLWLSHIPNSIFQWSKGELTSVPQVENKVGMSILTDRDGAVWIGFADGTLVMIRDDVFRSYSTRDGLAGGGIGAIFEDSRGAIWAGSENGLSRFDGNRFVALTAANGLPGTNIRAVVEDEQHALWFGVTSGIARLEISEFDKAVADRSYRVKATLYDSFDGLKGVPVTVRGYPTGTRRDDGTLWFVTTDGLAIVDPHRLQKQRLPAPVKIERVVADGQSFEPAAGLSLPQLTSRLEIDYTGLSFVAPGKLSFRYRLDGFDTTWVDAGTRRQAYYTNLTPGRYQFRVMSDNNGVLNETGASLAFVIAPALYQTIWFRLACISLLALAALSAWQIHLRQVRRRLAVVFEERARVAREIHDTLLQSLVGVAMQFDTLSAEMKDAPRAAISRSKRLREQIEMHIREARQSIWDLRSPILRTKDLATALKEAGATLISDEAVRFDLSVVGRPRDSNPLVEETLLRIGQEAISNAIRHGEPRLVRASLLYREDEIVLTVTDDGCGFDVDDAGSDALDHYGLLSMRERARIVGGHLRLRSQAGGGTSVEVSVPLSEALEATVS